MIGALQRKAEQLIEHLVVFLVCCVDVRIKIQALFRNETNQLHTNYLTTSPRGSALTTYTVRGSVPERA